MKTDYTYCTADSSCLHRRGCRRWVGNYPDKDVVNDPKASLVDVKQCIPDYTDKENTNVFGMLDRFRFSTGEEFDNKGLY